MNKVLYAKDTLEFVTVATEFCVTLEQCMGREQEEFVQRMLKLLPLIYLKVQLLPQLDEVDYFMPDEQVTEEDYEYVRQCVAAIMGDDDMYEDSTYDMEMQQTEQLCWKTVSEGLADLYQPLRNFVTAYRLEVEDCMATTLSYVQETFRCSWGVTLVDVLRRLHYLTAKS